MADTRRPSLEIVDEVLNYYSNRENETGASTEVDPGPQARLFDEVREAAVDPRSITVPSKQSRTTSAASNDLEQLLLTLKVCLLFHFDRCCTDRLFNDKNKWTLDGNDVVLTFRLCETCTEGNALMAETYRKCFERIGPIVTNGKKSRKATGLWRLFRLKYTLAIHPCFECTANIRKRLAVKVSTDANGESLISLRMCKQCVEGHLEMTQLYNDHFTGNE